MRPTEEQFELLSKKEQKIFNLNFKLHTKYRKFTIKWQTKTGRFFTRLCISRRIRFHNLKSLDCIKENSKVIIIANHRSYFDFWPVSFATIKHCPTPMHYLFPVRSNFFYERLLGFWMNFFIASASMFPPIIRERNGSKFNQYSLDFIEQELNNNDHGTIVGIHPEGKRSKLDDPHQLLPGKNGIGKIIKNAPDSTIVIPTFIHGISNNPWREIKNNYKRNIDAPIDVLFGSPLKINLDQEHTTESCEISSITKQCMEAIQTLADNHKNSIHCSGTLLQEEDLSTPHSN